MSEKPKVEEILNRPFPNELIKQRPGTHGKMLDYVEGAEYIRRLNEAFGPFWDFSIVEHFTLDEDIVVRGLLHVELNGRIIKKEAFGGSQVKKMRNSGKIIALADDYKSAATDALKKACSLLGIGLHLYSDSNPRTEQHQKKKNHGPEPMTERQLVAITAMWKQLGRSKAGLLDFTREKFHANYNDLNRQQASEIIGELKEIVEGTGE